MEPNKFEKVMVSVFFLGAALVCATYAGYLMGIDMFHLVTFGSNTFADNLVSVLIFYANLVVVHTVGLRIGIKTAAVEVLLTLPAYLVFWVMGAPGWIISTVLPISIVLGGAWRRSKLKEAAVKLLIFFGLVGVYQAVTAPVKAGISINGLVYLSWYSLLMYSIDALLFMYACRFVVEVFYEKYIRQARSVPRQHPVHPLKGGFAHGRKKDTQAELEFKAYPLGVRLSVVVIVAFIQVSQLLLILAIATLGRVLLEAVLVLFFFILAGKVYT